MNTDCLTIDEIHHYIKTGKNKDRESKQADTHLADCEDCETQYLMMLDHKEYAERTRQLIAEGKSNCITLDDAIDYTLDRTGKKEKRVEIYKHIAGCNECSLRVLTLQRAKSDIYSKQGTIRLAWFNKWKQIFEEKYKELINDGRNVLFALSGVQLAAGASASDSGTTRDEYLLLTGFSFSIEDHGEHTGLRITRFSKSRKRVRLCVSLVPDNIAKDLDSMQSEDIEQQLEKHPEKILRFTNDKSFVSYTLHNTKGKSVYSVSVNP